ncbi:MAG: glycosyltransferase [Mangrovibacterium sp.]
MKILVVSHLYPLSGESKNSFALHYFVKEWSKKHEVKVARLHYSYEPEKKPATGRVLLDGVEVSVFSPLWVPVLKLSLVDAEKILRDLDFEPDVIVAHLYNAYLGFAKLARRKNIPLIAGIHKSDIRLLKKPFHKMRVTRAIKQASGVVFRSVQLEKKFRQAFPKLNKPGFIAHSGVPEAYIQHTKGLLKNPPAYSATRRIISVCQLIPLKQIDKVLLALNEMIALGIADWTYTLIGEGPEMQKLKNLTTDLGLNGKVTFKGRLTREKAFGEMQQHDIFIMPSYKETLGIAYLEAMASGCVVIGSQGWGIDGIVEDNRNGYLCDPYRQESITETMRKALTLSDGERARIRTNSLQTISGFSEQKVAGEYLNFILSVVEGSTKH